MKSVVIVFVTMFLLGCQVTSESAKYTDPGFYLSPVLRMKVVPTFASPVIYEVSRYKPYKLSIKTYEGAGGYDWGNVKSFKTVVLSSNEYDELIIKLKGALKFPQSEKVLGTDGDTWMLESSLYQYTAVAFWEPEYNSEKRGIKDFVNLKKYLVKLSSKE